MAWFMEAACGCHTGRIRKNNEDNFFFGGTCLPRDNNGLEAPLTFRGLCAPGLRFAVFDGMGGENFGEYASFAAAEQLRQTPKKPLFAPEETYLEALTQQLNDAVAARQTQLLTDRMGTTFVSLSFAPGKVWVCNVGDSRAYRLRGGALTQLSVDDSERRPGAGHRKAPLTQYLGYGSQEILLEPHIAAGKPRRGDIYLLCSDGLTDMLPESEISDILLTASEPRACVEALIRGALEQGGRDNITAIVCKIL